MFSDVSDLLFMWESVNLSHVALETLHDAMEKGLPIAESTMAHGIGN